jgi:hypothetical protein
MIGKNTSEKKLGLAIVIDLVKKEITAKDYTLGQVSETIIIDEVNHIIRAPSYWKLIHKK